MPRRLIQEAQGLISLALAQAATDETFHRGAVGHLKAAGVQLDAASALLGIEELTRSQPELKQVVV